MKNPSDRRGRLPIQTLSRRTARRGIQIGPRIRVGGTLGAIGEGIKQNLGQVAKVAAVPLSLANPALGAALAIGGRALHTNEGAAGVGDLLGAGAKNVALGKLAGPLVRALPGGIGTILGGTAGASLPNIPGAPGDMGDFGVDGTSGSGSFLDSILGLAGKAGNYIANNPLEVAMGGLAGAQALAAAQASARAGNLQDKALSLAEQNWAGGEPLRTMGRTRLVAPQSTDLSAVYADPTNPFSRARVRALPTA